MVMAGRSGRPVFSSASPAERRTSGSPLAPPHRTEGGEDLLFTRTVGDSRVVRQLEVGEPLSGAQARHAYLHELAVYLEALLRSSFGRLLRAGLEEEEAPVVGHAVALGLRVQYPQESLDYRTIELRT